MLNLEWYRTFKAVYQTNSFTAASKILFISQPNVSQHLSALEAHVGKQLFERKPRLVPTDYGKLFYTQIVEPIERLEDIETEFRAMCRNKILPTIRLGAVKEFFHTLCAPHIQSVPANFILSFGSTKELIQKLSKGDLEFVIATQKIVENNISYQPILNESFTVLANTGMDTSELDELLHQEDWPKVEDWLLQQTWFAYSANLAIIRRFWLNNFKKRPAIKPRFIIPDMNTILHSISKSSGLTISAAYLAEELLQKGELKEIWTGINPTLNTLYLAYDQRKVTTEQISFIEQLLAPQSPSFH
ncbi:LysR family transcriptional regulator [Pedobacter caeni]|uniref:DNA-binding transcriptional regulator, LysR family n=1 Tax=Pedobacter caeni TaxID=288992 RepID=A0A1M5A2V9_9SPHI|nr:LysR family transcriptional regulator [Pedobacter caeni]SHF24581.1 DNA-binding transcriptional regulator, LysR family [Pedobacter caeni]